MKKDFSQGAFEKDIITQIDNIERNGVGRHKKRSLGALRGNSIAILQKRGYDAASARSIVNDCFDMAELERIAD